jgi:hypothetical protein
MNLNVFLDKQRIKKTRGQNDNGSVFDMGQTDFQLGAQADKRLSLALNISFDMPQIVGFPKRLCL